jgi:hypothetical protein
MVPVRQITREVESVLRRSREILYLDHGFGLREYLESVCATVTALFPIGYKENESRANAYDRMSAHVLKAALKHPPVTFATYGHPKVHVYPTVQITEAAKLLNLRVQVLPGISSLDCLLIDVGLDPGFDGLQMYEATDLLVRDRPLQPDVPCFLWQIGPIESSLYSTRGSVPERFERLKQHLLKYYPPSHRCQAVTTSTYPLLPAEIESFTIDELPEKLCEVSPVATLYIAPAGSRKVANFELVEALGSVDHLQKITA